MKVVAISDMASSLLRLLDHVSTEPIAIEQSGESVAFIVSPSDFEQLRQSRATAVLGSLDAIHEELALRNRRGEFSEQELMQLKRDLDRKAS